MENKNLPAVIQQAVQMQKINLQDVNLLLPTKSFGEIIGEYDKVVIEVIQIDPDPKKGDVYEIKKGEKTLGKRPLQMMANALGIIWDPANTGIIESTSTKARAKATGGMRKPNGEWIILSEEKTVDIEAIEEEQRLKFEEDAEKGRITGWETSSNGRSYPKREPWKSEAEKQAYIDIAVRKAVLPYRKFKDERANTGAKERVIRAFVAIKNNYTTEELRKPLAVPRVILDTSKMLDDPRVRDAAIGRMTGAISNIFGEKEELKDVTPKDKPLAIEMQEEPEITDVSVETESDPFEDDIPWETKPENMVDELRTDIIELLKNPIVPDKRRVEIEYWLENDPAAKIEKKLIDVKNWLAKRINGGAA